MYGYGRVGLAFAVAVLVAATGCRRFAVKMGVTFVPFTTVSGGDAVAPGVTKLEVDIRAGELKVVGDARGRVDVTATVKIKESLANPAADRGTFADHVSIVTNSDTFRVADAHTGAPDEKDWRVSLVVHVPPGLAVNLRTSAGRIVVTDTTSDIKASSGAGEILVRSTTPAGITLNTGAGRIDITVDAVTGPVTGNAGAGAVSMTVAKTPPTHSVVLTAGVGDVTLAIPPEAQGTFNLRADVGRVTVAGHTGINVTREVVSAVGRGKIGTGTPTYKLEASAGSVHLK
ncbi:MAG: hypothetical protein ACE5E6_09490 [Phycisphaerae bacterium]